MNQDALKTALAVDSVYKLSSLLAPLL